MCSVALAWKIRWRQVGLALLAGSTLVACHLIAGLDAPSAAEAPLEAGADADAGAPVLPSACDDSTPPRPARVSAAGNELPFFDLVLGYINSVARADAGRELCPVAGFNLDTVTTCQGPDGGRKVDKCPVGGASCPWAPSCANANSADDETACDLPGGTDNALGKLLSPQTIALIPGANPDDADPYRLLRSGAANLLIRILGYNGDPDDDDVSAAFLGSTGLASTSQATVESGAASSPSLERWDGRSLREWYVDPNDLAESLEVFPVVHGYVSNHVLVLQGATFPLPIFLGYRIALKEARLTGELRKLPNGAWEIVRGRIGGRISPTDLIKTLSSIPFGAKEGKGRVCNDQDLMLQLKSFVCQYADLPATAETVLDAATSDGADADADADVDASADADADASADAGVQSCKMISVGAAFVAVPATRGTPWAQPSEAGPCPPSEHEQCE